ncbi:fumarylacetoacetate hydrolase family protein [Bacillus salipaludis]|uniref:Fumarylacetoacetate hydrolase family protein n=1 Tax=Bacillus salipaludis TaxID=2547811 RepID=A0ABW8RLE9_9BACI
MNIIRFMQNHKIVLGALTEDNKVFALPQQDFISLMKEAELKRTEILSIVNDCINDSLPLDVNIDELELVAPIQAPEVWAAGVTYEKSREARNYESTNGKLDSQTFYDKVYDAERPEIFLKSTSARLKGPNDEVYLRSDSNWQIPEPELGLVISSKGKIVGYTIGNDMSSRDIEGENPLYLPQAKIWKNSCTIGPTIRLAETVKDPYNLDITCRIYQEDKIVFEGIANTSQLKRKFDELVSFLIRDNEIFEGTVLLTGTCIVPPNEFTLKNKDRIEIEISDIGVLSNPVKQQVPYPAMFSKFID